MGEARRRANGADAAGGGKDGGEGTISLNELIKRAAPIKQMPICPLPLMNFRPSLIVEAMGGDTKQQAVPALPCLGQQCIMYSEGIIQTDTGFQRRPVCGFGGAAFTLSNNIGPTLAVLGATFAAALDKALAAREEVIVENIARSFADALDAVFPPDDDDEPEAPGVKPPAITSLAALVPTVPSTSTEDKK